MLILLCSSCMGPVFDEEVGNKDWPFYGGNPAGNRYSELSQINAGNVDQLQVAWTYTAGDSTAIGRGSGRIICQPIVVDGILYGIGSKSRLFALNASNGQEIWSFQPPEHNSYRGLNFWQSGSDRRILYVAGSYLYAVDANTGKLKDGFGENGRVDFHLGLEDTRPQVSELSITSSGPGVIYQDVLVMGSTVSEYGDALPGDIRGFDVRTGALRWIFHTIPRPGELGYDTWPADTYKRIGGANCWAGMVLDESRGVVYLGTGSPSVDFYGGHREGANLFANCILALDALSGKLRWHFQTVHHDLWDLDIPCPPNLLTVRHNGKMVDALVQTTKDGLIYVLDRDTGASLFPIEERAVPSSGLPGEHPYPTQPFPLKPAPLVTRQIITPSDLPDSLIFPEASKEMRERFSKILFGEKFIPPSKEGIWYIGTGGGALWGGNAVDPDGILYQNVNEIPTDLQMIDILDQMKESASRGNSLYLQHCSSCHGPERAGNGLDIPNLQGISKKLDRSDVSDLLTSGRGRMPTFQYLRGSEKRAIIDFIFNEESNNTLDNEIHGNADVATNQPDKEFPYVPPYIQTGYNKVRDAQGYPGIKPPWGTLNAVDLNTGELLWRVPLGEIDELSERGIPVTGTHTFGGPIVTHGDLIFIAATEDLKIRAYDKNSGNTLWEHKLPKRGSATPITYAVDGKQYVVIAAGGYNRTGTPSVAESQYIAFSLP